MRLPLIFISVAILVGCSGTPPTDLGVVDSRLAPCPDSPNCVSSFATAPDQAIRPLAANLVQIQDAIAQLDEATIVESTPEYLHVEFTSAVFQFVDDVEFLWDAEQGVTQLRSASRLGYSDLGANRARIEDLRGMLK
jgi:uncharacterized protein (DUF1499 family)